MTWSEPSQARLHSWQNIFPPPPLLISSHLSLSLSVSLKRWHVLTIFTSSTPTYGRKLSQITAAEKIAIAVQRKCIFDWSKAGHYEANRSLQLVMFRNTFVHLRITARQSQRRAEREGDTNTERESPYSLSRFLSCKIFSHTGTDRKTAVGSGGAVISELYNQSDTWISDERLSFTLTLSVLLGRIV